LENYGKSKIYRPIDLSTHPSWQEAKAAEDDVRQAAALARKVLKIAEVDVGCEAEKSVGFYKEMMSIPQVKSTNIEQEIEGFITFMCTHRFMRNVDSTEFMNAYTFYVTNNVAIREQFPNIHKIMAVPLLLFMSNAVVESGFSTMNQIHDAKRNALASDTIQSLVRVKLQCPSIIDFKNDVTLCKRILSTWEKLPSRLKYGSVKHKIQSQIPLANVILDKKRKELDVIDLVETKRPCQLMKLKFTLSEDCFSIVRDGSYHEAVSEATALSTSSSFRQMITSSRQGLPSLPKKKVPNVAYMKLDGSFYTLTLKDAKWALYESTTTSTLVQL